MPRKYLMSWKEKKRRWVKMHEGTMYRVSCIQLNAPLETKEASYKLANAWWERKLAELNRPDPATERLNRHIDADIDEEVRQHQAKIQALLKLRAAKRDPVERTVGYADIENNRYVTGSEAILEADAVLTPTPATGGLSIGEQMQRFLEAEKAKPNRNTTYTNLEYFCMKLLKECRHLQAAQNIGIIRGPHVQDVYNWLRTESEIARGQQKKAFNHYRAFVDFLSEHELIDSPKNLRKKGRWKFGTGPEVIPTFPTEQVRDMIAGLTGRMRLFGLLALNCGMYGVDIGSLRWEQYKNGRIKRKRTRTEDRANVPTVEYVLWPETEQLLQEYKSTHPEFVLVNKLGTPLWRQGKARQVDAVGREWHRAKLPIKHKYMRHIGSTKLKEHREYWRWHQIYLGHAPRTMADTRYAAEHQPLIDEAIMWLREQFL